MFRIYGTGTTRKFVYMRLWPKEIQELIRLLYPSSRQRRQLRHRRMMTGKHTQRARKAK